MRIDLIVYDFDGVMTDNKAFVFQDGTEAVRVNRSDGIGISGIRALGIKQVIISTEVNSVVKARADKLKLPVFHGVEDKKKLLLKYLDELDISLEYVMYLGNDINDLEAMKAVKYPVCPNDAYNEIKSISKLILNSKGGEGVVRELFGRIKDKSWSL